MASSTFPTFQPMSGSMELVIELIWQHAVNNLSRTKNEILLPVDILSLIGNANLETIKGRLSNLLNAPVIGFQDNVNNVYRIMPIPALNGSIQAGITQVFPVVIPPGNSTQPEEKSRPKSNQQTKPEKIPRPPNAFILYRQHHHPLIKAAHPEYHNNDISVLLGKKWKAETAETKAHFKALADEIKRKHAEKHPNYQYAPRKPSEKKRRASARRDGTSAAFKALAKNQDQSSLQSSESVGGNGSSRSKTNTESHRTPPCITNIQFVSPQLGQDFEDLLHNQNSNLFNGANSPLSHASSITVPPLVPTTGTSTEIELNDEEHAYGWNNLDFDFDDYFIGGGE
ncbi:hypothetical protein VTO42DRAFT_1655 [Malbranchea cinnamomea]